MRVAFCLKRCRHALQLNFQGPHLPKIGHGCGTSSKCWHESVIQCNRCKHHGSPKIQVSKLAASHKCAEPPDLFRCHIDLRLCRNLICSVISPSMPEVACQAQARHVGQGIAKTCSNECKGVNLQLLSHLLMRNCAKQGRLPYLICPASSH